MGNSQGPSLTFPASPALHMPGHHHQHSQGQGDSPTSRAPEPEFQPGCGEEGVVDQGCSGEDGELCSYKCPGTALGKLFQSKGCCKCRDSLAIYLIVQAVTPKFLDSPPVDIDRHLDRPCLGRLLRWEVGEGGGPVGRGCG